MVNYTTFSQFQQQEADKLAQSTVARGTLSVAMSLPNLYSFTSKGFALGAMLGAPFAGIGAIPGAMIGGLLGGAIAFIGSAIVCKWLMPKLAELGLALWRRIRHGSEDYRYHQQIAGEQTQHELEKMLIIAKQFKSLQANGQAFSLTTAGLSNTQIALFQRVFSLVKHQSSGETVKQILSHDPAALALISAREHENLNTMMANKRWAQQRLKLDPSDPVALPLVAGVGAGYPPLGQTRPQPKPPITQRFNDQKILTQDPRHAIQTLPNLLQTLLAMDKYQLYTLSERAQGAQIAYYTTPFKHPKPSAPPLHETRAVVFARANQRQHQALKKQKMSPEGSFAPILTVAR